jgi:hypothetical protein
MPEERADREAFTRDIFDCRACDQEPYASSFTTIEGTPSYAKFPAIIGAASGSATVLFVGINPLFSKTNLKLRKLYQEIMRDVGKFEELGANVANGRPFIGEVVQHAHYRSHYQIIRAVFGKLPFEEHAAITELYLCATPDSGVFRKGVSPCAKRGMCFALGLW